MGRKRDEGGRYQETVSVDAVLELFTDTEPRTTSEVAETLDVAQRTAYNKLEALTERGDIRKKKIGGLAVVWWRPDPPETEE
ncbi:helix-turn-helix domain-containing protein [Halobellus marinus]|uniref:helix-turn-helix domain-containing protein n=1 Tax=Halobellus TaxID=1073986 RepID=UPI0028AC9801|nr:helix-turn-helix domain-containing protein [Halobellus sp. DFY28]